MRVFSVFGIIPTLLDFRFIISNQNINAVLVLLRNHIVLFPKEKLPGMSNSDIPIKREIKKLRLSEASLLEGKPKNLKKGFYRN